MLGDKNDAVGRRYIGTLKDAGYDYMELPLAQIMEFPKTVFQNWRRRRKKPAFPVNAAIIFSRHR